MDMFILRDKLAAVAPVVCVSIGNYDDKSTWEARYSSDPTPDQLKQVQSIIEAYRVPTPEEKAINAQSLAFLNSTDWKIIRHNDQETLGINKSLTQDEYIALLQERQAARDAVIKEGE